MAKSTVYPRDNAISVKNSEGTDTGVYIRLDTVNDYGECRIEIFSNITTETRVNEFDNSTQNMFVFNRRVIFPWSLPGYYIKDGVEITIGTETTTIINGKETTIREVSRSEAEAYIEFAAKDIAGFGVQTKIKFVE